MRKVIAKKIISILFLSIFVSKMGVAVAPLIIAHLDSKTVNAVIMQLEIEHSKAADSKDFSAKEILTFNISGINLATPVCLSKSKHVSADHDKHVQAFYPSVPTPPPNC